MANPSVVEAQVRFALSQLPVHNAHHEFEHICRHLTQQFICSNVLPATGPVSAGGDQGRDFETFRTYMREELGPHGAFLGLVSEGTITFICTLQADDLPAKLTLDIKKVCASGHPVHEIRAFTLASVPVGTRHKLETETQESYEVRLELHDAQSITNLLARPEGFWIAERFLSIPAEIRPDADIDDALSPEYVERRSKWREKGSPYLTLGDFVDLKAGLRYTIFDQEARADLPFWLGLLRQFLASPDLPPHIRQRARYELVVVTFRGTRDFRPVDDVARSYLNQSLSESEPARLQDASALLMYANTAVRDGVSSLTPAELSDWNARLTRRIQGLLPHQTPHRRASLLDTLGYLGLHPVLKRVHTPDSSEEAHVLEHRAQDRQPSPLPRASMSEEVVLTDVSRTLSAWTELMEDLDKTPLFPIQTMADTLQLLLPLWSTHPEWRELLDLVDEAVGERQGKNALAARARDRAIRLLRVDRRLDALEELHRVKIDWWSGESIRGSLLAMMIIARLYLELSLPQASKSYALAVAYIAEIEGDEVLADLIPAGLLMAANADFAAGAWCNATELYLLGLAAQHELVEDGIHSEKHSEVDAALLHLAYASACARIIDTDLAASICAATARLGVQEIINDAINVLNTKDNKFWESFVDKGLVARPFADLGEKYHIHFSALGTQWTLITANDIDSVRVAERFAAAAQVMLAALARDDLCLVQTRITLRVEKIGRAGSHAAECIESLPSNDGRDWVVRLAAISASNDINPSEIDTELLTILAVILRDASLLPEDDISASLQGAFERGLRHKLSPGRPYDQLAAAFAANTESMIQRSRYNTPWACCNGAFREHDELRWQDGPGPTYSRDKAKQLLETRYKNLAQSLRITVVMLASSEEFRPTVERLRREGWLDWHILAAIVNIVLNHRFPPDRFDRLSEVAQQEMIRAAVRAESATAEPVPIGLFTLDAMNRNRQFAMLDLLNHWGLECHQETPDIPAIERLLADRYGYWNEDVPHHDAFPHSDDRQSDGKLVVVEEAPPPQHEV